MKIKVLNYKKIDMVILHAMVEKSVIYRVEKAGSRNYPFPRKCDFVYNNVITNDVICAPFVTTLLKRSGETKIDIALVHLCDFRHCPGTPGP